jgi:hemoglobin/transferrin/lactoferrin receptor protein
MFLNGTVTMKTKKIELWGVVSALLLFLVMSNAVLAESDTSDNSSDQVIVIIGKIPRVIDDVLGSASVVTRNELDEQLVHDFNDLARYLPEISVEQSGTRFGQSSLSIRGIGGNRVAMEIDGIPVADQFNIGSYSNSGRSFVEPELLQQVEILRGPASSVYGSDAIGGVVNFIRRKPRDLLSQVDGNTYIGLSTSYHAVDDSTKVSTHGAFVIDELSGMLSLSRSSGHEFDYSANLTTDDSATTIQGPDFQDSGNESLLLQLVYDLSVNEQLIFAHDIYNSESQTEVQSILGIGRFRSTNGLLGDDQSERSTTSLVYDFESPTSSNDFIWMKGGSIKLFQQKSETIQLTDESRFSRGVNYFYDRDFYYQQEIDGVRANLYTDYASDQTEQTIGFGVELSKTKVKERRDALQTNLDDSTTTNIILSEVFPVRDFPISEIEEIGIYLNNQIEFLGSNWLITPAIRFDYIKLSPKQDTLYLEDNPATNTVSVSDSNWSPKIGAEYKISEEQKLYLQYIRGFRSPPFEDANIGLDIPLFNIRAIPNPELKSETSDGFEVGYQINVNNHRLRSTLFFNEYKDFIQTKVNLGLDPDSGRILFQSQNLDSAEIYGGDISYQYRTGDLFSKDDTVVFSSSFYKSKGINKVSSEPLNQIGPAQLIFKLDWTSANSQWKASLVTTTTDSKKDIAHPEDQQLFEAPGYTLLDGYLQLKASESSTLSIALLNITDRTYWNWSAIDGLSADDPLLNLLSAPGRSVSLQYRFFW